MLWKCLTILLFLTVVSAQRLFYKPETNKVVSFRQTGDLIKKKHPSFCNKLDCPDYDVVGKGKGYELREYKKSAWITTNLTGVDYKDATEEMFYRLFDYIQGKNDKQEKIAMTAPVLIRLIPGQGPACKNDFKMSFFVSSKDKNPPKPTDPTVSIERVPKFTVYVGEFGGFARTAEKWLEQAVKLQNAIGNPKKYDTDFFITAGYDSPFKFFNRHNEVWFIAKKSF